MMPLTHISFPTSITFGPGARAQAGVHLRAAGLRRPLVVTDKGIASLPIAAEFLASLEAAGLQPALHGGVAGNPTAAQVSAGVAAYRLHEADSIVGFGGGAAMDVAKAVALMAVHEGSILEYAWDEARPRPIDRPLPHFIALPTTAGTGSEVGRSAVISDDRTHIKRIVFSPVLLAKAVFADPELTYDLPAAVTAATGIDALTHNIESYLSPVPHPLCDGIALEGTRLAAHALAAAVSDGRDTQARSDMLMSSLMGGVAFQKDLGAVHSCAHALGAVANLHHGLANAIMLDHVMRFNLPAAERKMAELARVAGAGPTGEDLVDWLIALKRRIRIPATLSDAGVKRSQIGPLVEVALRDTCHRTNPRPCSREDFEKLFEAAFAPAGSAAPWAVSR